jgi:hypothetical protein
VSVLFLSVCPFGRPPVFLQARDRDRTGDLILTKDALYRLSYASAVVFVRRCGEPLRKRATGLEPATLSLEG